MRLWTVPHLTQALGIVVDAELACKSTGAPDQPVALRTVMRIAAAAGAAARA